MKKHTASYTMIFAAALSLMLAFPSALAEKAPTPSKAPVVTAAPISPKVMMSRYQEVVKGTHSYIQCNPFDNTAAQALFTTEFKQWYGYEAEKPFTYTAFCITDLDADGSPEIILKLSDDFGFELLRYENNAVYGFPFVARAMIDITLNGDIYGSSGALDSSWYQIRFHEGQYAMQDTCRMQSTSSGGVQYFVKDKQVEKATYESFVKGFADKKRPTWMEFSLDNFAAVVSKF